MNGKEDGPDVEEPDTVRADEFVPPHSFAWHTQKRQTPILALTIGEKTGLLGP